MNKRMMWAFLICLNWGTLQMAFTGQNPVIPEKDYRIILESQGKITEIKRLQQLENAAWTYKMHEHPETATEVGYVGLNGEWSDLSKESIDRRKAEVKLRLQALESIDRSKLSAEEQLNYDIFKQVTQMDLDERQFPYEILPVNQMEGIQQSVPSLLLQAPQKTIQDYQDRISRLKRLPKLVDQIIDLMKLGVSEKVVFPKIIMRDVPSQIEGLYQTEMEQNPLFESFRNMPDSISKKEQEKLKKAAIQIIKSKVFPAYQKLHQFLVSFYLPNCRDSISWSQLPNGKAWYLQAVRGHTATSMTPEKIHQLGLSEVARIREKMIQIVKKLGFKGELNAFFSELEKNPGSFHTSKDALVNEFKTYEPELKPHLKMLFKRFPQIECEVKPVPQQFEKSQAGAYMEPGSIEQGRPSVFYVNTYDLKAIPRWTMRTLFLHEAIPGHHFQLVLAQENRNLPEFRKYLDFTSFVEGWALYAETLGYDLQFFNDPYSQLGQLTYEMLRAVRLVVDTGMHFLGWSRDRAIQYYRENTFDEPGSVVEIDRYIAWPGQALAYKVGQLKLQQLRNHAQQSLGAHFDIREFHDLFLRNGTLPLPVLEGLVENWIEEQKKMTYPN